MHLCSIGRQTAELVKASGKLIEEIASYQGMHLEAPFLHQNAKNEPSDLYSTRIKVKNSTLERT